MEVFRVKNGKESNKAVVNNNGTTEFDATKGERFIVRVNGKKVKDWKVPNCKDQTQMIDTKGCTANCGVRIGFKNTGCNRLNIFTKRNGRDAQVGHINPKETTHVDAVNGQKFWFKTVEDNKKVKDWQVKGCKNTTQNVNSGACPPDCKDIKVSTSRGVIKVTGLKKAPVSEVIIMDDKNKQVAGCRKCNSNNKSFSLKEGRYWIKVRYYSSSWKRLCEIQKDVDVKKRLTIDNTVSGRVLAFDTDTNTKENTNLELTPNSSSTELSLYPNPARDVLIVDVKNIVGEQFTVSLINARGAVVSSSNTADANATTRLDVSQQAPGIYLVRIEAENGKVTTKTVMIR